MSKRYIPIARKFFESEEWTSPRVFSEQEAWLDMVFLACFADHDIDLGKEGVLHLERGEFYYTQRQLAKRWGWPLSKVNRYLARLAEGANPRIEKVMRETRNETQSETQVETQIAVVRLCNYAHYNKTENKSETHIETQSETQSETLNNKGDNNKGVNNTHTQYLSLRDLFVRSCMRDTRDAHEAIAKIVEEMVILTQMDAEASQEHRRRCINDKTYDMMFWLWWKHPDLQLAFRKPVTPQEMGTLLNTFRVEDIADVVEQIENKRDLTKNCTSLFLTIKQWAKRDPRIKQLN